MALVWDAAPYNLVSEDLAASTVGQHLPVYTAEQSRSHVNLKSRMLWGANDLRKCNLQPLK